ncbi:chlorophyll synthesis pathway protein BchC [Piscinibacter sp. Jin2]|uniref:Chlorophyll synthesis pathway protein BchC n=1 Tax=Aquariibacter lacus TaxID=2801332 RepID=A0A9X0XD15_9BURK|nr:chlorophyll synthesis pathway protein BchC [Piscinibacter lacus]MBL0719289.1 chlorophyll synthesis pathway protein BchC [Piscinibacter lacus]
MNALAVVFDAPQALRVSELALQDMGEDDVTVAVEWSGISTGTERLLWSGRMPAFQGMGYPLVPGYETVGRVVDAGPTQRARIGQRVFVPGAKCFGPVRSLFGGAASRLVLPAERALPIGEQVGREGVLLALAATAYHAVAGGGQRERITPPELIVGHGVLGRLLARMTVAAGCPPPTVWERDPSRSTGGEGYTICTPEDDPRRRYRAIYDASGDAGLLDELIMRLAPGGEVVLAGFYSDRLSFAFAPAFMREAALRCAAEWKQSDLMAVRELVETGRLSLDGLITHQAQADQAPDAYTTAFEDPACLKMVLNWSTCA